MASFLRTRWASSLSMLRCPISSKTAFPGFCDLLTLPWRSANPRSSAEAGVIAPEPSQKLTVQIAGQYRHCSKYHPIGSSHYRQIHTEPTGTARDVPADQVRQSTSHGVPVNSVPRHIVLRSAHENCFPPTLPPF